MSESTVVTILDTVLAGKAKPRVGGITASTRLREDLGLDSLDLAELTVRIEAEFGVDVFAHGVVSTVGEILGKLNR